MSGNYRKERHASWSAERGYIELGLAVALLLIMVLMLLRFAPWGSRDHMGDMGDMMRDGGMMGGGRDSTGAPVSSAGLTATVVIEDYLYVPGNLRVPVGATVTWRNVDSAPHSATAQGQRWDTGLLSKGKQASISFDEVGEYVYYCIAHPQMKARIQVQ